MHEPNAYAIPFFVHNFTVHTSQLDHYSYALISGLGASSKLRGCITPVATHPASNLATRCLTVLVGLLLTAQSQCTATASTQGQRPPQRPFWPFCWSQVWVPPLQLIQFELEEALPLLPLARGHLFQYGSRCSRDVSLRWTVPP